MCCSGDTEGCVAVYWPAARHYQRHRQVPGFAAALWYSDRHVAALYLNKMVEYCSL